MDVFSTELGIRLSFVKTSEFRGGGFEPPQPPPLRYATEVLHICSLLVIGRTHHEGRSLYL
jgi:hypothetical protein